MFCSKCSNLCEYQDSINDRILYSICHSCNHKEIVSNLCIFKKNYNIKYKHNDLTLNCQFQDPTLPQSSNKCNTCHQNLRYIRNDNLSSTLICSNCFTTKQ